MLVLQPAPLPGTEEQVNSSVNIEIIDNTFFIFQN